MVARPGERTPYSNAQATPRGFVRWYSPEWTQPGSNRRPSRCQRDALPAELWAPGKAIVPASRPEPVPAYTHGVTEEPASRESAELLLRGYHAFVAGDIDAIEEMLDPDVEWVPAGESDAVVVSRDRVLEVVAERAAEGYHVVVDRALGLADHHGSQR